MRVVSYCTYLPYSPDLNLIEKCWSWLKSRIRKKLGQFDCLRDAIEGVLRFSSHNRLGGCYKSFVPQVGVSASRTPFQPEKGKQYQVGVKGEFLQGRLSSTLALYDITRSNVLTADPNNPDFSIQVGEQHSQGLEIDIVGKILPEWNIITSYAYTNATITKDNTYAVGNRLDNVPF